MEVFSGVSKIRPSASNPDVLEAQAREHLSAGRWRKARDGFKELCKQDPRTFRPLLVEANVGLARSMLAQGLISEARQVVTYLKTLASADVVAGLELELAACSGDAPKLVPGAIALLASGSLAKSEQLPWADKLVVAFAPAETSDRTPAEAQVAADVRAIQDAIESACAGDCEGALELIRPLKRDSALGHWRLFVRGLVAFQRGEAEKAVRFFEDLPADSAPGRARAAWLLLLGKIPDPMPSTALIEATAAMSGQEGWGRVLVRAETLWRAGDPVASYRSVRDSVASFPSEGLDLSSVLTEFYFNSIFLADERLGAAYGDFFVPIEVRGRAKNRTELSLIRRTFCLVQAGELAPDELAEKWEAFLVDRELLHGPNPRLTSLGWAWLGEVLARPWPSESFVRRNPKARDATRAIAALEKSIALDPANAAAHLVLSSVYETAGKVRERNRLLDAMTTRFPENKEVLIAAGAGCIDRKSLLKAIDYFERALLLDRLDPKTPDLIVSACLRLARQRFQKGRPHEGRIALDRASKFLVEGPENFLRNPWCFGVRHGVLEQIYGDAAKGADVLTRARAASPFPAAFLYFVQLASTAYSPGRKQPAAFQAELARAAKDHPTVRDAALLVQLWSYWRSFPETFPSPADQAWLRQYLKRAAKNPFTRDEARRVVELLRPYPIFADAASALTAAALRNDRGDPLFRLYEMALQPFPERYQSQYRVLLDEATRRGDAAAVKLARELIAEYEEVPHLPTDFEWDDEPEDSDDDVDIFSGGAELDPTIGPGGALAQVVALLAMVPESDIDQLRKIRPKGMPRALFDALVAIARTGPPVPTSPSIVREESRREDIPRTPRAAPKRQPPPVDRDQIDLL